MRRNLIFIAQSIIFGLALAFLVVLLRPSLLRQEATPVGVDSYADAVARARPAVVNIYTRRQVTNNQGRPAFDSLLRPIYDNSLGSGVLVDEQGHILTNLHVISRSVEIYVLLADGRFTEATLRGSDLETDLALLKIDMPDLTAIPMGRSDQLRVGDVVLAIGNPLGLNHTVTQGIVSATGRRLTNNRFDDFIQTDALINQGNSGGALINTRGELIGINTAVLSSDSGTESVGIGFAIPVNMARGVMNQLLEFGRVRRGWLGVTCYDVTPEIAARVGLKTASGLYVARVYPNAPAQRAGLERGDVITELNGRPILVGREALGIIANMPPGTELSLTGVRGTQKFDANVKVSERPRELTN